MNLAYDRCRTVRISQDIKLKSKSLKFFPIKGLFLANFCSKTNFSCHFLAPGELSRVLLKVVLFARWLHPIIGGNHRSYRSSLLTVQCSIVNQTWMFHIHNTKMMSKSQYEILALQRQHINLLTPLL